MPAAIANRSVDGVSVFDPFAYFAEQRLGPEHVTFQDSAIYSELYLLTVKEATLKDSPDLALKMMRALIAARNFIRSNPAESKVIVARYTKLDPGTVDAIWGNFVFAPSLTARLIDCQQQEAAWAKANGTFAGSSVPDFRNRLAPDALRQVDPTAVAIQ